MKPEDLSPGILQEIRTKVIAVDCFISLAFFAIYYGLMGNFWLSFGLMLLCFLGVGRILTYLHLWKAIKNAKEAERT